MTTIIRPEISTKNKYWISKHRYYELKHMCLQYKEWVYILKLLDKSATSSIICPSDNVFNNSELYNRLYLEYKIKQIQDSCKEADEYLCVYIFKAVTEGLSYTSLKMQHNIPCGKDMYYDRYRKFFWILSTKV